MIGARSAYLTPFETKGPLTEEQLEKIINFQFHGYLRGVAAQSSTGANQVCFRDPGAPVKYRLGNECDDYAELQFQYDAYRKEPRGTYFRINARLAFNAGSLAQFQNVQMFAPELYVEAANLGGTGPFAEAHYWAGKRFYRQDQVHINDFYFWDMSGPGGGIEDVDIGIGKLAFAYGRTGDVTSGLFTVGGATAPDGTMTPIQVPGMTPLPGNRVVSKYQLRLASLSTFGGGTVDVAIEGRKLGGERDGVAATYGIAVYGMHTQRMLGGFNQLIFQYGQGLAADLGVLSDFKAENDARTYRIIDWTILQPSSRFTASTVVIYQRATATQSCPEHGISGGARPIYNVTDRFHIALEAGADFVDPDGGAMRQLTKVTLAPELSVGTKFFDRPVLRIFGTFARWNDDAAANGVVLSDSNLSPFQHDRYGFTAGVQSEAWW